MAVGPLAPASTAISAMTTTLLSGCRRLIVERGYSHPSKCRATSSKPIRRVSAIVHPLVPLPTKRQGEWLTNKSPRAPDLLYLKDCPKCAGLALGNWVTTHGYGVRALGAVATAPRGSETPRPSSRASVGTCLGPRWRGRSVSGGSPPARTCHEKPHRCRRAVATPAAFSAGVSPVQPVTVGGVTVGVTGVVVPAVVVNTRSTQ